MWSESQWYCHYFLTSPVIVIRFFLGHVFILLGRLLRSDSLGQKMSKNQVLCSLPHHVFSGSLATSEQAVSRIQTVSFLGFCTIFYFRTHSSTSGPKFFVSLVSGCKRYRTWSNVLSLTSLVIVIRYHQVLFRPGIHFFQVASLGQICQVQIGDPWYAPYRGHCVCVYTVIANGSIFVHRACVILMKQGDHPCAVCDGPTKRPQYMRISRLITVTYLPSIEMY